METFFITKKWNLEIRFFQKLTRPVEKMAWPGKTAPPHILAFLTKIIQIGYKTD